MASSTNPSTAAAAAGGPFQIPINLYTQNPSHAIPQSTYLIPSDWKRYQLSELINKVLQSTSSSDASIPFDFLIDDTLLRSSLEEYIRAHKNGDTESTLNVEYLESLRPPKKVAGYQQDDWVSGVSVKRKGCASFPSFFFLFLSFSFPLRSPYLLSPVFPLWFWSRSVEVMHAYIPSPFVCSPPLCFSFLLLLQIRPHVVLPIASPSSPLDRAYHLHLLYTHFR